MQRICGTQTVRNDIHQKTEANSIKLPFYPFLYDARRNTAMIIKSDSACMTYIGIGSLSFSVFIILAFSERAWSTGAILFAIMLVFSVIWYVALFRQIELSECGVRIRISFGNRFITQKSWTWSELLVKETYNDDLIPGRTSYKERIVIMKKNAHISRSNHTPHIIFNELLHPLSFACLNVIESANFPGPHIYPVSRTEFFNSMKKWGITEDIWIHYHL